MNKLVVKTKQPQLYEVSAYPLPISISSIIADVHWVIGAWWRVYASVDLVNMSQCVYMSCWTLGTSHWHLNEIPNRFHGNALKMSSATWRPLYTGVYESPVLISPIQNAGLTYVQRLLLFTQVPDVRFGECIESLLVSFFCSSRATSRIPQYTKQMPHIAPVCNRNVHISVTKWYIVENGTGALWNLRDLSILHLRVSFHYSERLRLNH